MELVLTREELLSFLEVTSALAIEANVPVDLHLEVKAANLEAGQRSGLAEATSAAGEDTPPEAYGCCRRPASSSAPPPVAGLRRRAWDRDAGAALAAG